MTTRTLAVANYLLRRNREVGDGSVSPMQLIKLTYIAHGWMLGLVGRPLLDEDVEAWRYGPVVPSLYHAVKHYGNQPVENIHAGLGLRRIEFDEDEKSIMDQVIDIYGKFSGVKLSSMTHQRGTPWDVTWSRFGKNAVISNDLIEEFYQEKAAKDDDADDDDGY